MARGREAGRRHACASLALLLALAAVGEGAQEHFRWLRRSECTEGMPGWMQWLGIDNVCADMTLEGCSETVRVGLRFKSQATALVEQELSLSSGATCTSSAAPIGSSASLSTVQAPGNVCAHSVGCVCVCVHACACTAHAPV